MNNARRLIAVGAASTLVAAVALTVASTPAGAVGTVPTTTTITSVSGPTYRIVDGDLGSPALEVKGTSDGSSTNVQVRCYYGNDPGSFFIPSQTNLLNSSTTLDASGSFDVAVRATSLEQNACMLRVLPTSAGSPTDVTPFHGKLAYVGEQDESRYDSGSLAGGSVYDFYAQPVQSAGSFGWDSATSCGPYGYLVDSSGTNPESSSYLADCLGYFARNDTVTTGSGDVNQRSGLQVDGVNVYGGSTAEHVNATLAGPGVTWTLVQDPTTGDTVVTESDPLVACPAGSAFPADSTTCTAFTPVGVRVDRITTINGSGRVATVKDLFVSTDGRAHSVSAQYEEDFSRADGTQTIGFRFPSDSAYVAHAAGDTISGIAAGAGTMYATQDIPSAASFTNPQVALSWSVAPTGVLFYGAPTGSNTCCAGFYLTYTRAVPAGGSIGITHAIGQGTSTSEVQGYATTSKSGFASSFKVTLNALPATVGSKALTVTGTFTSGPNGPATSATVGTALGQVSVPVAPDGSFSAPVTLQPGTNSIAVMGNDGQGLTAATSADVVFANPVKTGTPKVARSKNSVGKVTKETVTVPVSCASFGPATGCRVTLKLTAKGKALAPTRTVTVRAGTSVKVTLTLSGSARKIINGLKQGKHLTGTLHVTFNDPAGGTLALPNRSVKLA